MALFSSGTIKVPITELKDAADKLYKYSQDSKDLFDIIGNALTALESNAQWQGASMLAAKSATDANKKTFQATMNAINEMASSLDRYVYDLEQKDREVKKQIEDAVK